MLGVVRRNTVMAVIVGCLSLVAACSPGPEVLAAYVSIDGLRVELTLNTCNADVSVWVVELETTVEVTVRAANDTTDDCADNRRHHAH